MTEPKEITDLFPTENRDRRAIAIQGSEAAKAAFEKLREGLSPDEVVVAYWVKPRYGNHRNYSVLHADALSFVVAGVLAGWCRNLMFFVESRDSATPSGLTYQDLFLS